MAPLNLSKPTLYVEHDPETHRTVNPDKTVTEVELPGFLTVGVVVGGVKVPLQRVKAGKFLARYQAARGASGKSGSTSTGG